jgi:hypothetical protein
MLNLIPKCETSSSTQCQNYKYPSHVLSSITSRALNLAGFAAGAIYPFSRGFPIAQYGDSLALTVQSAVGRGWHFAHRCWHFVGTYVFARCTCMPTVKTHARVACNDSGRYASVYVTNLTHPGVETLAGGAAGDDRRDAGDVHGAATGSGIRGVRGGVRRAARRLRPRVGRVVTPGCRMGYMEHTS